MLSTPCLKRLEQEVSWILAYSSINAYNEVLWESKHEVHLFQECHTYDIKAIIVTIFILLVWTAIHKVRCRIFHLGSHRQCSNFSALISGSHIKEA